MKGRSKRLSSTEFNLIENQLHHWFSQRLSRQSFLPFQPTEISTELAIIAATLFKRGSLGVKDLSSNEEISLKTRAAHPRATTFTNFARWSDFFESFIAQNLKDKKISLIVDQSVLDLHPNVKETCKTLSLPIHSLNCTEEKKSLKTAWNLYDSLSADTETIIVVGGGICCDVAGFVGALLKVEIILIPTTLLALVDAGLGGKTGVNDPFAGKNQIGLFADIQSVISIQELHSSLTSTLIKDGLAEIMKHAWLCGKFKDWNPAIEKLLSLSTQSVFFESDVQCMLLENIEFKNKIVLADPFERDIRVVLNLGHTIAHLLEGLNQNHPNQKEYYPALTHGQAVCHGLWALISSGLLTDAPKGFLETLERIQNRSELKIPLFKLVQHRQKAVDLLLQDKKNTSDNSSNAFSHVRCVLPPYGSFNKIPQSAGVKQFMKDHIRQIPCETLLKHLCDCGILQ